MKTTTIEINDNFLIYSVINDILNTETINKNFTKAVNYIHNFLNNNYFYFTYDEIENITKEDINKVQSFIDSKIYTI